VRWEAKKMPLLIWISPGIQLPEIPFSQIQSQRVDMVTQILQSPQPFQGLPQAPGWTPDTNDQVAAGIEQWREFEKEGLFSFAFTDDPRNAHIMVFFTDNFKESDAPGGIAVGGVTSAQIYPYAQAQQVKIRQKPVIIELSTSVNHTPQKMQGATAHEFGHALGIKAHSPYREDIMNVDRVVDFLSPSDKATIRYLYHKPLQWVM
jgi:predicted Zn-dependent protease